MNLRSIDLNLLPILAALLDEKSTVRAAERIGLSQSAVSAALSRLRDTLGDPLFVRHGQKIVPTDFALSLEVPLANVLQGIKDIVAGPEEFDPARATDRFTISGSDFYTEMLMPKLARIFSEVAPYVRLHQVDLVPDNQVASVAQERIDLALLPKTEFPEWVTAQPVHHSSFILVARKDHPRLKRAGLSAGDTVPIDLVSDLSYLLLSAEGNRTGIGDAALARIGRSRRVVMTLPTMNGVLSSVAGSDLCAFVPEQIALARAELFGLSLYQLPFHMPRVEINMIWHRRHTNSPAHIWLRNQVAAVLGEVDRLQMGR
jgi:DNA-binding transcriptional LysR family regulator